MTLCVIQFLLLLMGSLGWCWKSFPTVSAFNINNQWKNIHAFIAVKTDDTVVAYGNEESGGGSRKEEGRAFGESVVGVGAVNSFQTR